MSAPASGREAAPRPAGEELALIRGLLQDAAADLRRAVDLSLGLDPRQREAAAREWEDFLRAFIGHVRTRGRETGENLLSWVSFARIWR